MSRNEAFAPWQCPLCGGALQGENDLKCEKGHCFDRAREGYWHLLPVQSMRTKAPGDSKEMVAARRAFLNAGYYGIFGQALELLPTTLPQGLREVSSSLLTSLTAVDLAALERTLEFLATSAEPVDITADALPGDWAGGHYTVSDASRAAVQSFFNLSPAAAQSASGSEP